MCLIIVSTTHDPPLPEEVQVYKVFEVRKGELKFQWFGILDTGDFRYVHHVPHDIWIYDKCMETRKALDDTPYQTGFHAYINQKTALDNAAASKSLVVVQVTLRQITAFGNDMGDAIVGREMFVASNAPRWVYQKGTQ